MSRINRQQHDEDDRARKNSRSAKHSRNIPGAGMRLINSMYDEDYDLFDTIYDDIDSEDYVEIVHTKSQ